MPEHAEPGFLPGVKCFHATIHGAGCMENLAKGVTQRYTYEVWAYSADEAREQARETARRERLHFETIVVAEVF